VTVDGIDGVVQVTNVRAPYLTLMDTVHVCCMSKLPAQNILKVFPIVFAAPAVIVYDINV
jgi:hypothetical protein